MKPIADGGSPALTFDWTAFHEPSRAVVEAVGTLRNEPPEDLPPLQRSVDADSLDSLLEHLRRSGTEGTVKFEYVGCRVVLAMDGDGRIFESRDDP